MAPRRTFYRPRHLWLAAWTVSMIGCPDRSMDEARALEAGGQYKEAAERYFGLAKQDPANLAAWDGAIENFCRRLVNVGRCIAVLDAERDLLGNIDRHHEALSEVLELRARARMDQGMVDAALDDLGRAEKAGPERASVHAARAKALLMVGKRDEALRALGTARRLDPNNEEANALFKDVPDEKPGSKPEDSFGGSETP